MPIFGVVIADTVNIYSSCTDKKFIYSAPDEFYAELSHKIIESTMDDPTEKITRARQL